MFLFTFYEVQAFWTVLTYPSDFEQFWAILCLFTVIIFWIYYSIYSTWFSISISDLLLLALCFFLLSGRDEFRAMISASIDLFYWFRLEINSKSLCVMDWFLSIFHPFKPPSQMLFTSKFKLDSSIIWFFCWTFFKKMDLVFLLISFIIANRCSTSEFWSDEE